MRSTLYHENFKCILSAHNTYQVPGGEDNSCLSERNLLKDRGHDVIEYDYSNDKIVGLFNKIKTMSDAYWNNKVYKDIKKIILEKKVDLVHVQNFFPRISPSIFHAANELSVPVVFTIRNYRLLCSNGLLYRDNKVCEECLQKKSFLPAVKNRCYRGSYAGSFVVGSMSKFHDILGTWKSSIDLSIVLTDFAKDKYIEQGWDEKKLFVKPNFATYDYGVEKSREKKVVFVGRFSHEKGVLELIEAWEKANTEGFNLDLIGDGPLSDLVNEKIRGHSSIRNVGRVENKELVKMIGKAMLLVFPSKWYEGMPRTIIEAYSRGTPVIAQDIGAMSSMVREEKTGLKYKDPRRELSVTISKALSNPNLLDQMSHNCRYEFENKYTQESNYHMLMEAYRKAKNNMSSKKKEKL